MLVTPLGRMPVNLNGTIGSQLSGPPAKTVNGDDVDANVDAEPSVEQAVSV